MHLNYMAPEMMLSLYQSMRTCRGKNSKMVGALGGCGGGYYAIINPTDDMLEAFSVGSTHIDDGTFAGECVVKRSYGTNRAHLVVCFWDDRGALSSCSDFVILVHPELAEELDLVNEFIRGSCRVERTHD